MTREVAAEVIFKSISDCQINNSYDAAPSSYTPTLQTWSKNRRGPRSCEKSWSQRLKKVENDWKPERVVRTRRAYDGQLDIV